jgi:hypothetical protein
MDLHSIHNSSYRHFRRPLLFSAAYTWPSKISPYFRRLFQAAENSLIFGGPSPGRRKYGYNNGQASLFSLFLSSRAQPLSSARRQPPPAFLRARPPPAAAGFLARTPAASERCLRPPPRRPPRRVPPPAAAFPARALPRPPPRQASPARCRCLDEPQPRSPLPARQPQAPLVVPAVRRRQRRSPSPPDPTTYSTVASPSIGYFFVFYFIFSAVFI